MEFRQLRYFVAVAEELNFSKAAIRLHMSQPPLSHQIKVLEEELGVELLKRDKRSVQLTPAGQVFLADCRTVLDRARAASNHVRQFAMGTAGSLRVGLATSAVDQVMPGLLARLRQHRSLADVTVVDMGSEEQVRALAQDRLDLGFIHARIPAKNLCRQPVHSEGFAVVLPRGHHLAGRANLGLADLADEPMVSFSREQRSALFDALVAACVNAGFSPRLVHVARHPMSMFQMVRHGLGVCIVPSSYARAAGDDLHVHQLPLSAGALQLDAVWNPDHPSELLRYVVEHLLPAPQPALSERMAQA